MSYAFWGGFFGGNPIKEIMKSKNFTLEDLLKEDAGQVRLEFPHIFQSFFLRQHFPHFFSLVTRIFPHPFQFAAAATSDQELILFLSQPDNLKRMFTYICEAPTKRDDAKPDQIAELKRRWAYSSASVEAFCQSYSVLTGPSLTLISVATCSADFFSLHGGERAEEAIL